jgi:hypothetical protein
MLQDHGSRAADTNLAERIVSLSPERAEFQFGMVLFAAVQTLVREGELG